MKLKVKVPSTTDLRFDVAGPTLFAAGSEHVLEADEQTARDAGFIVLEVVPEEPTEPPAPAKKRGKST